MKSPIYVLYGLVFVLAIGCAKDESPEPSSAVAMTGEEVWDRTIRYHDPESKWSEFAGAVRIVTAWADGHTNGLEYIELNNAEDSYRGTRRVGDVVAVKGVRSGSCYRTVNGNENPSDDEIKQYLLSCEDALGFQQHHGAHVGFPMIARQAGVKAEGPVERDEIRGRPVLAVPLVGDSTAVRHPYWKATWTLYVDPDSYAMRGYRAESDQYPGQLWIAEGELDVNGIKMPQVKNVYSTEDGSLQFTDLFSHIGDWERLE